jgi:hypothetical protein
MGSIRIPQSKISFATLRLCVKVFGVDVSRVIHVYLRLSRSNVRYRGVSRTINHQELAEVIGTGFICG